MRIYLILHLVALIITNQFFRSFTSPLPGNGLNPMMWFGFSVSCIASLWIFSFLLKHGVTFGKRIIAFFAGWAVFYLMWSASIVFASQVVYQRLMRTNEVFILFGGSSGQQFEVWNRDAHFHFLLAALPVFIAAAAVSLGAHIVSRRIWTEKIAGAHC